MAQISNNTSKHMIDTNREMEGRKPAEEGTLDSAALYHSIVDNLPVCVFRKDAAARFVYVNSLLCQLKGMTADQILGKTVEDLVGTPMETADGAKNHEFIMETGKTVEREEMSRRPDGTVQYFQVVKSPVFDAAGKVVGSQGLLLDITQRKQAEAALAYERDLLRSLLDNSPDHVYFKDSKSCFIRASKELCERFKISEQEIIGKSDFDFFKRDHAQPAYDDEQEIIRSGKPIVGKIEREIFNDGREFWVLTTKMPLRSKTNEIIGTFGISKDITAIKRAEQKLEAANKQLLETSRLAGMAEVATSVLHNVGNVLNSVNISSSVVSDKVRDSKAANVAKIAALLEAQAHDLPGFFANDPKGRQLPGYLRSLAEHLAAEKEEMVKELTLLSNNIEHIKEIVAMQQSYSKVSGVVDFMPAVDLVEDAVRMNAGAIERHHVQLVRDYVEVPPVFVEKHKVLQILVNLIRNAKYALDDVDRPDKLMTLRIRRGEQDKVIISVSDNGVGIPAENLTRIFGHGFTTRKEGHGFGLHSGALAAKELGGSLRVHSDGFGKGAVFMLELPCQPKGGKSS
ncbi:MAG: sensor signal transduction histidine kinase [Pedosphaera sp.]|nr:sensor signal transduction histidine kinase [Pedosphaera sp.]